MERDDDQITRDGHAPPAAQPSQRRDALINHLALRAVVQGTRARRFSFDVREQRKPDAAHHLYHELVARRVHAYVVESLPGAAQETLRGGGEERQETHVFFRGVGQVAAQPPVLRVARLDNVLQRRLFSPGGTQRQETLAQVRRRRLGTRSAERGVVRCERGLRGRAGRGGRKRAGTRSEDVRRVPAAAPPSRTRGARGRPRRTTTSVVVRSCRRQRALCRGRAVVYATGFISAPKRC